jgi:hypothetical protein
MARKSEVLTMPVVMKDEKEYSNCVDVLDQLEKWTQEIYTAAGLCSQNQNRQRIQLPQLELHPNLTNLLPMSHLLHLTEIHCMV